MNKSLLALLFMAILGLSLLSHVPVRAQDDDGDATEHVDTKPEEDEEPRETAPEDEDEEDWLLTPHRDVSIAGVFPAHGDRRLFLDTPITLVVGFANKGGESFNITGIGAHLHHPHDYSFYIQNFTGRRVMGAPVGPGQQAAAEYQFQIDPSLEPQEYGFSAWVIYNNSNEKVFMHTFMNTTVELVEPATTLSPRSLFTTFLTFAGVAVVAYVLYQVNASMKPSKKRRARVEQGTRETAPASDLPIYSPAKGQRPVTARRRTPSRKAKEGRAATSDNE